MFCFLHIAKVSHETAQLGSMHHKIKLPLYPVLSLTQTRNQDIKAGNDLSVCLFGHILASKCRSKTMSVQLKYNSPKCLSKYWTYKTKWIFQDILYIYIREPWMVSEEITFIGAYLMCLCFVSDHELPRYDRSLSILAHISRGTSL